MDFRDLTQEDKKYIVDQYKIVTSRAAVQDKLAKKYNVSERTIRSWHKRLTGDVKENSTPLSKVLVYDFETARIPAWVWNSGEQFVSHKQLKGRTRVITVSWKWLGSNKVYHLKWDTRQNDEELIRAFANIYNEADFVVGHNVGRFDNRILRAVAALYDIRVNPFTKMYDTMKEGKRLFKLPSYSLSYMCEYLNLSYKKLEHEGIIMWEKVEEGTKQEQKEWLQKMVDYNVGDILANEGLFLKMLPYDSKYPIHVGVAAGGEKWHCPHCGGSNVEWIDSTTTQSGTIQHIMRCKDDGKYFKISNRIYLNYINS